MFAKRPPRDEAYPLMLRALIDAPPPETKEQWLARRSRELGVAPATLIPGPSTRSTDGRDNG